MRLLLQRMVLLLYVQIDFRHFPAALNDPTPQLFSSLSVQPVLDEFGDNRAAFPLPNLLLELLHRILG